MDGYLIAKPGVIFLNPQMSDDLGNGILKILDEDCKETLFEGSKQQLICGVKLPGDSFVWLAEVKGGKTYEFERTFVPKASKFLNTPQTFINDLNRAVERISE